MSDTRPTRQLFDLDLISLERFTMLVGGVYNTGKTHLGGDMLVHEREHGPVRFINATGEDGYQTVAGMGLGQIRDDVKSYQDCLEATAECRRLGMQAVFVDGARTIFNFILTSLVGEERLPDAQSPTKGGDGDRARSLWAQARFQMEQFLISLHTSAKIVLVSCMVQEERDESTGQKRWTPDIYGKMGDAIPGAFDFSGLLEVKAGMRRDLSFQYRADARTRQRLPYPLKEAIQLVNGPGSWAKIKAALEGGLPKREVKK